MSLYVQHLWAIETTLIRRSPLLCKFVFSLPPFPTGGAVVPTGAADSPSSAVYHVLLVNCQRSIVLLSAAHEQPGSPSNRLSCDWIPVTMSVQPISLVHSLPVFQLLSNLHTIEKQKATAYIKRVKTIHWSITCWNKANSLVTLIRV